MKKVTLLFFVVLFILISVNTVFAANVYEDTVDGEFNGWEGETIIKLMSGQIWIQKEYYYHYHYHYMPKALLICHSPNSTECLMQIQGVDKHVRVERIR